MTEKNRSICYTKAQFNKSLYQQSFMANIPTEFINDLLQRIDIVELIDEFVPLKRTGGSFVALCPFHDEKTPSFNVSHTKQIYHCFGCSAGGNAISFLLAYERLTFPEAVEKLATRVGLTVPTTEHSNTPKLPQKNNADYSALLTEVTHYYCKQLREHSQAKQAIDYLKNRGISGQVAKQFQLGFAPPGRNNLASTFKEPMHLKKLMDLGVVIKKENGALQDRFYHRIMFPIQNIRGQFIGFGSRVLDDAQQPKYLNSPESDLFKKSRELYGLYQCLQHKRQPDMILIVEGYMDVIALAQFGIHYAVATMGTATSKLHLQQLTRCSNKIVFCFDGDKAGYIAAWRALTICLSHYQDGQLFRFMFLPQGEDPDTLIRREGKAAFEQRIATATSLPDFFTQHLQQQVDFTSLDGRSALVKLATPLLQTMPQCALKDLLEEKMSHLSGLNSKRIHELSTAKETAKLDKQPINKPSKLKRLNPIQITLSLLLQYPSLIKWITDKDIFELPKDLDALLLQELVSRLQAKPNINTATLIEQWRHTPHAELIFQLVSYSHLLEPKHLEAEFKDTLQYIKKQAIKYKIDQYYLKISKGNLTQDEKVSLQKLIEQFKGSVQ